MGQHTLMGWLIGLVGVSLILGSLLTWLAWEVLGRVAKERAQKHLPKVDENEYTTRIGLYSALIGIVERICFTLLVALEVPSVGAALAGWIVVKMATGWQRSSPGRYSQMLAFAGLTCTLVSLTVAVVGGLLANGKIPL